MTNYVPVNNTIRAISCAVLIVSIGHALCTLYARFMHALCTLYARFMHNRVGLVFDEKTHCFQSYNQGYRKTGNN